MSEKDKADILAFPEASGRILKYIAGLKTPREYFQAGVVSDATLRKK